jgi:hypothetical protein
MLDSHPDIVLAEVPRGRESFDAEIAAHLAAEVVSVLRQRGVAHGPVLMLADSTVPLRDLERLAQLQLTRGSVENAASLVSDGDFTSVVVVLAASRTDQRDALLSTLATRLRPDVPLVLVQRLQTAAVPHGRRPDPREAVHLALLRSGYDRVWVHTRGNVLCASAKRAAPRAVRTCSIIVPVFNEKPTFPALMQALLAKRLDHLGLEREIIIVESNSTDGSRELVAAHAASPGVKVLWQDRPRGKGHAVREGLRVASGDIVLIQDADLEYDVNDYDALLEPLLQERAAFVLGSRHNGRHAMRRFTDQRLLGALFNFGHLCFTLLINVLYGQEMKDPFTMFKVFRRDCLYGLPLECNRFDFDHELLIKLVLKGYRPLEIPVTYRSRSFRQGKKIRPIRDALTWIVVDLKFRLRPLRPHLD